MLQVKGCKLGRKISNEETNTQIQITKKWFKPITAKSSYDTILNC